MRIKCVCVLVIMVLVMLFGCSQDGANILAQNTQTTLNALKKANYKGTINMRHSGQTNFDIRQGVIFGSPGSWLAIDGTVDFTDTQPSVKLNVP